MRAIPRAWKTWLGGRFEEVPVLWQEASPLTYADADSPPTLFINSALTRFHAGRDAYIRRLTVAGATTRVHTLADTPHPFWLFDSWFEFAALQVQTLRGTRRRVRRFGGISIGQSRAGGLKFAVSLYPKAAPVVALFNICIKAR